MKTTNTRTNRMKPLGIAFAGGALMLAPVFGAIETAQAKPPAHAPAHGYYKNKDKHDKGRGHENRGDHRDRDRDRDWERDRDRDRDYDRNRDRYPDHNRTPDYNRGATTLNGVVTRNPFGDKFEFRADNGRTYLVEFYDVRQQPRGLSQGDRIAVYGDVQGSNIAARNVRIISNR